MDCEQYYSIITPKLFFTGLRALLEQEKPIGGMDGSIMADVLWPTTGPENKDEIGEALLAFYFSKNTDKVILNLPYEKNKDILELEDKAKNIVRHLIDFIDEFCYKGYILFEVIEALDRPYKWYIENFISGAYLLGWVTIENRDDDKIILPTTRLCNGFEISRIRDSRNRRIGY